MTSLMDAVQQYKETLEDFLINKTDNSIEQVIIILTSRDNVAKALDLDGSAKSADILQIATLDQRLKKCAEAIVNTIKPSTLKEYREALNRTEDKWWWSLDIIAKEAKASSRSPLWTIALVFGISVSVGLITDITTRFLVGGPDTLGTISIASQGFLALLAGSTITQAGRKLIDRVLTRIGIKPTSLHVWRGALFTVVLLLLLGLKFLLPTIALHYHNEGLEALKKDRYSDALKLYKRAIALNPDLAETHYDLGNVYIETGQYDLAISENRRAIELKDTFEKAYNNLAYLYIHQKKDYNKAIALLGKIIPKLEKMQESLRGKNQDTKEVDYSHYTAYKNLGLAYLKLNNLIKAREKLYTALYISEYKGAEAHCLLAQVIEAQMKAVQANKDKTKFNQLKKEATKEWDSGIKADDMHEYPFRPLDPELRGLAEERIREGGEDETKKVK